MHNLVDHLLRGNRVPLAHRAILPPRTCNVARQAEGQGDPRGQPQAQKRFSTGFKGHPLAKFREVMVARLLQAWPPSRRGGFIPRRRRGCRPCVPVPVPQAVSSREAAGRFQAFNGHVIKIQMTRRAKRQAGLDTYWYSHRCRLSVAGICACRGTRRVPAIGAHMHRGHCNRNVHNTHGTTTMPVSTFSVSWHAHAQDRPHYPKHSLLCCLQQLIMFSPSQQRRRSPPPGYQASYRPSAIAVIPQDDQRSCRKPASASTRQLSGRVEIEFFHRHGV